MNMQIGQGGKYPGQAGDPIGQRAEVVPQPMHGFIQTFCQDDFDPRAKGSDRIDENAVRRMGYHMLVKMKNAAARGLTGWFTRGDIITENIEDLLRKALADKDYISVANYAMMLTIREEISNGPKKHATLMPPAFMRGSI